MVCKTVIRGFDSLLRLHLLRGTLAQAVVLAFSTGLADAQTGWLAGLHDPLVARTLSLLHGAPQRKWTLASLAEQAGSSRPVLAERFARFVGQPPMHYLTQWRMQRAIGLLAKPGAKKVAAVAESVGYGSEAAFSRAFKKCVGATPAEWRQRVSG